MKKKEWSGERLETFIYSRDTIDHLHRYAIACNYVIEKKVLDIACGEGYGSNLLSKNAKFVYGVDIDSDTIKNAKIKYKKDNIKFIKGSTSSIPLKDNSVDIVVSFETLEHHDEHDEMMSEIKRVLKPEGIVIISTPDKYYYSDVRKFNNEYHVKELYKNEFLALVSKKFKNVQLLSQKYVNWNSVILNEKENSEITIYKGFFHEIAKKKIDSTYLIALASDNKFENQTTSIFEGSELLRIYQETLLENFKKSTTFKIGYYILMPFQYFKRMLK
jgi:ubiquinone/menaquinone biosynthesis C-methylase UbiE